MNYLGAPECYRINDTLESHPLQVTSSVDIWSFGCILSEAAVWVVHGLKGLKEYRRRREQEIRQISRFRDDDCFHNGQKPLDTVLELHESLAKDSRQSDFATGPIVDMLIKAMMQEPAHRPTAKDLLQTCQQILATAENNLIIPLRSASDATRTGGVQIPRGIVNGQFEPWRYPYVRDFNPYNSQISHDYPLRFSENHPGYPRFPRPLQYFRRDGCNASGSRELDSPPGGGGQEQCSDQGPYPAAYGQKLPIHGHSSEGREDDPTLGELFGAVEEDLHPNAKARRGVPVVDPHSGDFMRSAENTNHTLHGSERKSHQAGPNAVDSQDRHPPSTDRLSLIPKQPTPFLSVEEAFKWRLDKKSRHDHIWKREKKSGTDDILPNGYLINQWRKRDHVWSQPNNFYVVLC